jgi:hypothetical protein
MRLRRGTAILFGVAAMFAAACGAAPTQPTSVGAPAEALTAPGAVAGMSALSTAALTAADLSARGWSCRPIPGGTGCVPPNQVVPSAALPPEDRPAVVVLLSFNANGAFVGPATMVRADHYNGQPCESTGAPYTFFSLIGYYYCVRTAGM